MLATLKTLASDYKKVSDFAAKWDDSLAKGKEREGMPDRATAV